jgi:4-amino-4-deoxychorismate lyase
MYRFFESIQLNDGEFKRLKLHQERVGKTMQDYFPDAKVIDLFDALHNTSFPMMGLYKCRILYDTKIRGIEYTPYSKRDIHSFRLVETDLVSVPYKNEDRSVLNAAFALRGDCDEIILVKNGLLTDTSFSNIALYDGLNWYTPRIPLIYGVNRTQLVTEDVLSEKDITPSELVNFKLISLFNAMNEFGSLELPISSIYL